MSRSGWVRWIDAVLLLAAAVLAGAVVRGFAARVGYPFDLEWMEGGMLGHAWRLAHGLPLYPEPSAEWIPFVYPPGYPALLAVLSPVFGLDYPLGRVVSIGSTLLAAGAVATLVGRRGQWALGLACAALFLGLWRASGAFYDLVRPDALGAALVGWSLVAARERGRAAAVSAGLLLFAAFVVKQHAAALGVPLALGLWMRDGWRHALRFGLWAAVPALLYTLAAEVVTGGRFLQYLLVVPTSHPTVWPRVLPGTPGELGMWLFPALAVGAGWLVATSPGARSGRTQRAALVLPPVALGGLGAAAVLVNPVVPNIGMPPVPLMALSGAAIGVGLGAGLANAAAAMQDRSADAESGRWWLAWGVTATTLVVAAAMRGHNGGFMNVFMPMHLVACAGFGLVLDDLRRRFPTGPVWLASQALVLLQLGWVGSQLKVEEVLPTPADTEAHQQVLERLRRCEGPILAPLAAWLPVQVGQEPSVHLITIWDLNHERGPFQQDLRALGVAAKEHRWACVVQGGRQRLGFGIEDNYQLDSTFRLAPNQLMAKTGWRVRPTAVLVPKEARGASRRGRAGEAGDPPEPADPQPAGAPEPVGAPEPAGAPEPPGPPGSPARPRSPARPGTSEPPEASP